MRKNLAPYYLVFILAITNGSHLLAEPIAHIVKAEGIVYLKRLGMETFLEKAEVGSAVNNGDAIKVGEYGYAAVIFIGDRSVIKIKRDSQFQFMDTKNTRSLNIEFGTVLNKIESDIRSKSFRIKTPVSVASVKGTEFAAKVDPIGVDQFIGKEGRFEVMNTISGETVNVGPGQKAVSNATGNLMQAPAAPNEYPQDPETEPLRDEGLPSERETPKSSIESPGSQQGAPSKSGETGQQPESPSLPPEEGAKLSETPSSESISKPDSGPKVPKKPFSMGLGIGSATLDGVLYNQLALRPEINLWKIGIGLDLVVYIDNEGNVRTEEWDIENDPSLLLDKVLYIRYGEKSDPLWVKYGSIEGMTLGYGGLMQGYSNMMEFPTVRRVGVNTGFNIGPVGGEFFLANIKDYSRGGTLLGLRAAYTVSEGFPLSVGINFVSDVNMFSGLKDRDDDSYPDIFDDFPDSTSIWNDTDGDFFPDPHEGLDSSRWDIDADGDNIVDTSDEDVALKATPFSLQDNKAGVTGWAIDIGYPIFSNSIIDLSVYAEFNSLSFPAAVSEDSTTFNRPDRSGTGLSIPGIRSSLFGLLHLSMEYRIINGSYLPQFFDQAYDLNRVISLSQGTETTIWTKDMSVFADSSNKWSSSGLFGSANMNLLNLANFIASYARMTNDTDTLNSFNAALTINTDNVPKLTSAMAFYQRNNDDNPFDFKNPSENTVMGYRVGYELSKGVSLIWEYSEFYRDDGNGNLAPVKQTTIETAFSFF
ncbi:MAG: FecR family protein [Candidatus Neomarinimicrobiota bacterium]|nr:FecR family protein [Candidatus Neomarinimicrobiota bacterium]